MSRKRKTSKRGRKAQAAGAEAVRLTEFVQGGG